MKHKIISFILVIGLFFNNISFSYGEEKQERYAPAVVAIAPEIVSSIGAFIVASGGTIIGQKMLNDATRHFYNDNEDNWDNVVETFKKSVSIAKDGLVKIGSEFLSLLNNTFSKLNVSDESTGQNISHTGSYYGIPEISVKPFTGSSVLYVEGLGISISDDIVCGNIFFDVQGTTLYIKNNTTGVSQYTLKNYADFLPQFLIYDNFLYIYHINGSSLYFSKIKDLSYFGISDDSILDLPSISSDSLQLESDNSIVVGVPDTLDKFVDGTVNYDNIYNPSYPLTNGNVGVGSMPGVSNPSIEYGESITIENSGVNEGVGEGEGEGEGSLIPSFPNMGDELDFSPLFMTNIKDKFPFSLPWDFKNLIDMFDVDPVAPKFEVPFLGNNITLDFSYFEEWATIIRFFVLISFTATLIFITTKLKG